MAIYTYPPVSLTAGPTSFVKDGSTVTVNKDTVTPANSRPLPVEVLNSSGVGVNPATEAKQDSIITEIGLLAKLTDTQPVSGPLTDAQLRAAAVPVTANAGTNLNTSALNLEATQALIKAKTDNLDVALSTRNLEATQLLIKAKTDNLDVALSTVAKDSTLTANGVLLGAVTETAPATDTASSGLNGRLQRIAQRLTSLIALFPASLGSKAAASSFAVTMSTEDNALMGSLTETAPASDTASSGQNGRLQRIAQRLTSLIALLPTALGQGTMAQSLKVVLPSDQSAISVTPAKLYIAGTLKTKTITVGLTQIRATTDNLVPSATRNLLRIKPFKDNTGKIFIIAAGETAANGQEIIGPDVQTFPYDPSDYYLISDTAGQTVEILEVE